MTQQHTLDYRTRERPMHDADRVEAVTWHGQHITVGATIAYDVSVHDGRTCEQKHVRHEGVVVELWLEHWWGDPEPRPYAEVDQDDGTEQRVWFRRDHVTTELGFAIGPVLDGALF